MLIIVVACILRLANRINEECAIMLMMFGLLELFMEIALLAEYLGL